MAAQLEDWIMSDKEKVEKKSDIEITTTTKKRDNYEYSKSEASKGSTTVSASRTIDEIGDDKTIVTSTVKGEITETKKKISELTYTNEQFSDTGGHTVRSQSYNDEAKYNRKGRLLKETHQRYEGFVADPGALELATGYDQSHSSASTHTTTTIYDKKGNIKKNEEHSNTKTSRLNHRSDLKGTLAADQQTFKKNKEVRSTNGLISVHDTTPRRDFEYSEDANGNATAMKYNKKSGKGIIVHRNSKGNYSGTKGIITEDKENAKKLSDREAERIFKRCQKTADKVVRNVSEAQNTTEYQQQTILSKVSNMPVSQYFEADAADKINSTKGTVAAQNAEKLNSVKKTTTEQMVQQKFSDLKSR